MTTLTDDSEAEPELAQLPGRRGCPATKPVGTLALRVLPICRRSW